MMVNHSNVYDLFDIPGATPPCPGDMIRTNYGIGLEAGYTIKEARVVEEGDLQGVVSKPVGSWGFVVNVTARDGFSDRHEGDFYLNGYILRPEGRMTKFRPSSKGTSGYSSNGGGRDGQGYDEILIERRAAQGRLFS